MASQGPIGAILDASADEAHAEAVEVALALVGDRMFELGRHEVTVTARTADDVEICTVRLSVHREPEERPEPEAHPDMSIARSCT